MGPPRKAQAGRRSGQVAESAKYFDVEIDESGDGNISVADANTANPLLIICNLYDPNTRYEGAQTLRSVLPNSGLLTVDVPGHTSLGSVPAPTPSPASTSWTRPWQNRSMARHAPSSSTRSTSWPEPAGKHTA